MDTEKGEVLKFGLAGTFYWVSKWCNNYAAKYIMFNLSHMEKTFKSVRGMLYPEMVLKKLKGYSTCKTINIFITLLLMFLFGYLPLFPFVTRVGMKLLGILLGVMYGWTTVEIVWPSLFAIIAFGMSGYADMNLAITSIMGNNVVFLCIVAFLSAGALTYYGFGQWFVCRSLSLPLFRGRPMLYTWCFMIFFGLSALIIDQIQLQIILYFIWFEISTSCGYDGNNDFLYAGMAGILFSTVLGGAMIPYTSWMLGLAMNWGSLIGVPLNMGLMGAITIPSTVIAITLYVLSLKFIFKIDFATMEKFDVKKLGEGSKVLRPRVKRILTLYIVTVIIVILGNTLPNSRLYDIVNNKLTVPGIYCITAALLMIIPSGEGDGKAAVVFQDIYKEVINWNVIFMVAIALVIASAVTSPAAGIVEWVGNIFAPVFNGRDPIFILIAANITTLLLANLGPNIAAGSAMVAIIKPFVLASGTNTLLAGAITIYTASVGLMMPGASVPAAIYNSNAAIPNAGKRIKYTALACICFLITTISIFSLLTLYL